MVTLHGNILLHKVFILISVKALLCENVDVTIKQGTLAGMEEATFLKQQNYFSFKGIPYAEPPVGKLRFQPPKAHRSWEGTYKAYVNKPTCLQYSSRMRVDEPFGISGSEDCLYLSVFTPNLKGFAPVVVFDFNDNFRTGFNGTDTYSPEFFMEENVIVVTISHRLGLFGYLTTADEVIPGNNGIRDFILGLRWIKENIESFGGDSSHVTLMGSRGGAALTNIMLYSKKSKDLFCSVIMQSGTALEPIYFYEDPRKKAFELGKEVNIETDDSKTLLEQLQNVDAEQLLTKEFIVMDSEDMNKYQMSIFPFGPIIENQHNDAILTSLPEKGKIINDVPVLIGLNSREGLDLASHFIFQPKIFQDAAHSITMHFPIRPSFRFDGNSSIFEEAKNDINNFYYEDGNVHVDNLLQYAVYIGDALQSYALDFSAKKMAKDLQSPVFYYMFDFRGSLNENSEYMSRYAISSMQNWGATILDEICYLHLCSRIRKNYQQVVKLVSEQPEIKVLKKMVRLWTNFAKTSNPTPEKEDDVLKNFKWEPIDKSSSDTKYLHITKALRMKVNPLGERAHFWDTFLDKYRKMAVDGVVQNENKKDEL